MADIGPTQNQEHSPRGRGSYEKETDAPDVGAAPPPRMADRANAKSRAFAPRARLLRKRNRCTRRRSGAPAANGRSGQRKIKSIPPEGETPTKKRPMHL